MPQQPSPAKPQSKPSWAHVCGVHGGDPHTLGTPLPPHVSQAPPMHSPQLMALPQPSDATPHSKPSAAHVVGEHPPVPGAVLDAPPIPPIPPTPTTVPPKP